MGSGPAPIATEALARITQLYHIESEIRGRAADERRVIRQERSRPVINALEPWLGEQLTLISQKTKLAEAIGYALSSWTGLTRFLGRVEIDSNVVERAIRRKNALFAGSDGGAAHWATIASLIESCKLNGIEPHAYLSDVITRIVVAQDRGLRTAHTTHRRSRHDNRSRRMHKLLRKHRLRFRQNMKCSRLRCAAGIPRLPSQGHDETAI